MYPGYFYKMHVPGSLPQVWAGTKECVFNGASPDNFDANSTHTTFQDVLLKGATEWQRPGSRRARGRV